MKNYEFQISFLVVRLPQYYFHKRKGAVVAAFFFNVWGIGKSFFKLYFRYPFLLRKKVNVCIKNRFL